MSETKKRNVKVVESKTLSSRYDRRFVIVDEETENVLDDAQGYGYKSKQKAMFSIQIQILYTFSRFLYPAPFFPTLGSWADILRVA